ncbi:MAG: hypothetical protein OEZ39_00240 [Gammaproteobacteria bacterium]|nr:hypothetical protein [Gammaproteobacteria bacterium]MDH5650276.1 hypothetical protein [Gammaproteobacteria bacterium]
MAGSRVMEKGNTQQINVADKSVFSMTREQTLVWFAVPNGFKNATTLRLSISVTPYLKYSVPKTPLPGMFLKNGMLPLLSYPDFMDWPAQIRGIIQHGGFKLEFKRSSIGGAGKVRNAVVSSEAPDSKLWSAVFNSEVMPVRSYTFKDRSTILLQPIMPRGLQSIIDNIYRGVAKNKQQLINPVMRSEFLQKNLIQGLQGMIQKSPLSFSPNLRGQMGKGLLNNNGVLLNLENLISTEYQLLLNNQNKLNNQIQQNLQQFMQTSSAESSNPLLDFLVKPAEAASAGKISPTENQAGNVTAAKLNLLLDQNSDDLRDMEFHLAVNLLQEYPELLRWLGLVVDVEVPFTNANELPSLYGNDLQVRVIPGNVTNTLDDPDSSAKRYHLQPWSACVLDAKRFISASYQEAAKPATVNNVVGYVAAEDISRSYIADRMLRMDEQNSYTLTQLDEDGAAMTAMELAERYAHDKAAGKAVTEGGTRLPALRSAGLGVIYEKRLERQQSIFIRSLMLNQAVAARKEMVVYAEDMMRGLRVDVYDAHPDKQRWYPLCRRELDYTFVGIQTTKPGKDQQAEGQITSLLSQFREEQQYDIYRMRDMLFRWEGWSLSVPRCADPNAPAAGNCGGDNDNKLNLKTSHKVAPCTLPQLRYGRTYQFRARIVDIAGNSLAPPNPGSDPATANQETHCTQAFTYRRYAPLGSPVLVPLNPPDAGKFPGDSVLHVVIRSNYDKPATVPSHRHVLPPPVFAELAEHHGRFDNEQCQTLYSNAIKQLVQRSLLNVLGQNKQQQTQTNFYFSKDFMSSDGYLPDPLARGLSLAGLPHTNAPLVIHYGGMGISNGQVTKDAWPDLGALRLQLVEGDKPPVFNPAPTATKGNPILTVQLPKAETVKLACSSVMSKADLELMAIWNQVKQDVQGSELQALETEALQGQHWMLTPAAAVTLVHAVQQPLQVARFIPVFVDPKYAKPGTMRREEGTTWAYLEGIVDLHGKSTGSVSVTARWNEIIDDPNSTQGYRTEPRQRQVLDTSVDLDGEVQASINHGAIAYAESKSALNDALLLGGHAFTYLQQLQGQGTTPRHDSKQLAGGFDQLDSGPQKNIKLQKAPRQELGDTKHHRVIYEVTAATRFREYFGPMRAGKTDLDRANEIKKFTRPDLSVNEPSIKSIEVHIPCSVRPAAPEVVYIVPTFGWQESKSGTTVKKERKGNGLRVYLEGPWYSSGEDEMLGVVINEPPPKPKPTPVGTHKLLEPFTTRWAKDPVWTKSAAGTGLPEVPLLVNFKSAAEQATGLSLAELPQQAPSSDTFTQGAPVFNPLPGKGGTTIAMDPVMEYMHKVATAAFPVHYDKERGLWYSDIVIDGVDVYFPFIRLALARYQPYAVQNTHLSRVVLADFMQLTPDRFVNLKRNSDNKTLDLSVSGPAPEDSHAAHHPHMIQFILPDLQQQQSRKSPALRQQSDKKPQQGTVNKQNLTVQNIVAQMKPGRSINFLEAGIEKIIAGVTDADLKWQAVAGSTVILTPQAQRFGSNHTTWNGKLTLPGTLQPNTYRVVIREYEIFTNGRRLVYADTLEL